MGPLPNADIVVVAHREMMCGARTKKYNILQRYGRGPRAIGTRVTASRSVTPQHLVCVKHVQYVLPTHRLSVYVRAYQARHLRQTDVSYDDDRATK